MKSFIIWNFTSCNPEKVNRLFRGTYHLCIQGRRVSQTRNQHETGSKQALLIDPAHGGEHTHTHTHTRGLTIKFANSPPCACRDSSGQKPQYDLMTLAYQRFTAVLLLIYGRPFSEWRIFLSESVLPTTHGSHITTMHLLTRHCLRGSFQLVNK
jgi:hypothetical protein